MPRRICLSACALRSGCKRTASLSDATTDLGVTDRQMTLSILNDAHMNWNKIRAAIGLRDGLAVLCSENNICKSSPYPSHGQTSRFRGWVGSAALSFVG